MRVQKPPAPLSLTPDSRSVFLAGSIDMGAADHWQARAAAALADLPIDVLDPRRDEWDSSWPQSIEHAGFRGQVEWELDGLERADVIAMWFSRDSKSPITLLELGLFARSRKIVAGCPHGFWRRGNIEVVASRYGIALVADWDAFVAAVRARLG